VKSASFGMLSALIFSALPILPVQAQISKADSAAGWRPLFNGKDFNDFYFNFFGTGFVESSNQTGFVIDSGMIHVPKASPAMPHTNVQGHVFTKKEYSWYKVRVDYRFVVGGGTAEVNAGLIIHADNAKGLLPSKDRRPTSIEVNMRRPDNSPWTLWSAVNQGPYISSTIAGTSDRYIEGGTPWTNDPWGGRTILFSSLPNPEKPMGEWNHGEAWVYGDSLGLFYLNGQLRTQGWDFKVRGPEGTADIAKRVPWSKGGIGLQGEMAEIWYKNFDIMELEPHTKRPLHASDPMVLAPKPGSRKAMDRSSASYNVAGRRLDSRLQGARAISVEVKK
jgi:hypothetical protein